MTGPADRHLRPLWAAAALLVLAAPALRVGAALLRRAGVQVGGAVPQLFDLNTERNIPTWYAAALWILFAATAGLLAAVDRRRRVGLTALAAVGLLLSVDEAVSLHERYLEPVGQRLDGAPHFAWVLPGLLIAAGLAAALGRLVVGLPRRPRLLLLVGGAVFVLGAVGLETVSGVVLERWGDGGGYLAVTTAEEALEMTGVLLALTGLLSLLHVHHDRDTLTVSLVANSSRNHVETSAPGLPG